MSGFDRSPALESQPTTTRRTQYSDDPAFTTLSDTLSDKLFSLTSIVSKLSTQVGLLGTRRESERVRERVHDYIEEGSRGFKEAGEQLKKLLNWGSGAEGAEDSVGPSQRFTQGKLNREFQASLKEFQDLQRTALEKERNAAAASRAALDEGHELQPASPQQGGSAQQQQIQATRLASQDEVDFQESLIIERESEIRNIEQSVGELNELFHDVAHIVTQGGEQLDLIHENVMNTLDDTQGAHRELRSAARYQRNARNRMCCLLIILLVVLTIIILAVVLA
jgi:t-SNARE complex subunit (syntaxin)